MLINGKSEEIAKYSKLKYVADKFITKAKEVWEYTDIQIRSLYLISDLAKNGNGVFSVAYSTFKKMFEQRFKMEISLSTVRRFFALMEKLGLISINEAKRKNEQQSANIYIVEQQYEELQQEQPVEHPSEDLNISFQEINDKQKTLNNNVVNNVDHESINYELYLSFKSQGIDKSLFQKVLKQVENKKEKISNYRNYLKGALNRVVEYLSLRNDNGEDGSGAIDIYGYDWIRK